MFDIPITLRRYSGSEGPPVVTGINGRFILDTTRVQSVIANPITPDELVTIPFGGGNNRREFSVFPLPEYPIESIDVFAEIEDRLSVGMGSDFGNVVGSMLLLPPSSFSAATHHGDYQQTVSTEDDYPLMMVINPANVSTYCYEGTLGYVQGMGLGELSYGIFTLKVAVSVLGNEEIIFANTANEAIDGLYHGYYIDTTAQKDRIPEAVMYEWFTEVANRGLYLDEFPMFLQGTNIYYTEYSLSAAQCANTRHLFPSLVYTILVGDGPDDVNIAARIVLEPEDYMPAVSPGGRCVVQIVGEAAGLHYTTYKLGMNFIQRAALHFDYTHNRIGIGEPL